MLNAELLSVVENLCEEGCRAVTQHISDIEAGHRPRHMAHLDAQQCSAVLDELKSIMAVYNLRKSV